MACKIINISRQNMGALEGVITRFYPYAKQKLGFHEDIAVNLVSDLQNSKDPFGKTAYYDPNKMEITIFVDKRHVKDMLRSFSHELVHHAQNCRGDFEHSMNLKPGYAQKDPHMRRMEAEAYLLGNGFLVRDYEDQIKYGQLKENKQMSITKEQAMQIAEKLVEEMLPEQFASYKENLEEGEANCEQLHKDMLDAEDMVSRYNQGHGEAHAAREAYMAAGCNKKAAGIPGLGEQKISEEEVVEEADKMPDKNKDGIPDYAQDGKGKNDLGKAKDVDDDDKKDDDKEEKSDKDLSKVPPQLRKHVAKKKGNVNEEIDHRNNLLFERLVNKWTK